MTFGFTKMACLRHATSTISILLLLAALLGGASPAWAQFLQQGAKLIGAGAAGSSSEGFSVAISADGKTAIIGGPNDSGGLGAAWVFVRINGGWSAQGGKLFGADYSGAPSEGTAVALSADGNTAVIGGEGDDADIGAAWVFTRSNGIWTEQAKLIGGGYSGMALQGSSVGLSADGNTAIVGGYGDSGSVGAAWVFIRSGSTWAQQGPKLIGSGYSGPAEQGISIALSSDGNTAIVGGPNDNSGVGAAWIFTRYAGAWTQYGNKVVGTGAAGPALEGSSVALSGTGNTAIVGGNGDNSRIGAAWVFTLSNGTWMQQGAKLVGSGYSGTPAQGGAVALSADGNTAIVGGSYDNGGVGAAWVFARTGGAWNQGVKLVGSGTSGAAAQGFSVALSADGNTTILGGPNDNGGIGATWVFVRPNPTNSHDFNDDGVSDVLWRDTSGNLAMWLMSAGQFSSGAAVSQVPAVWSVIGTRDFNADGDIDILWRDTSGDLAVWLMDGPAVGSGISLGNVPPQWSVVGTGDFNGDGTGDILWRNQSSGDLAIWLMSNATVSSGVDLGIVPLAWQVANTGGFIGNGTTDILWRNTSTGDLAIWILENGQFSSGFDLGQVPLVWSVVATGDFAGGGASGILWRNTSTGDVAMWLFGVFGSLHTYDLGQVPLAWSVAETGDFDGDGKSDILWRDSSGNLAVWLMNGPAVSSGISLGNVGASWQVQGQNAD